jgi:hypothetical protein
MFSSLIQNRRIQRKKGESKMIFNLLLHIAGGIFGKNLFTLTARGILTCLLITILVQAIDMVRIYKYHRKRSELSGPEPITLRNKVTLYKFAQWYLLKVIFYGGIMLIVASIAR